MEAGTTRQTNRKSPSTDEKSTTEMFGTPHWQDVWAAILFILHLATSVGVGVYAFGYMQDVPDNPGDLDQNLQGFFSSATIIILVGGLALSIVLLALAMWAMRRAPERTLHICFFGMAIVSFVGALMGFFEGSAAVGIVFLIIGAIQLIFYFLWRSRIPFSAIILQTVLKCLASYPALYGVSAGSVLVGLPVLGVLMTVIGKLAMAVSDDSGNTSAQALLWYSVFSFYWTAQVIANVAETAIAGVFATYYFLHGTGQSVVNPTSSALRRATSYSFGSICFGSLVVALIQLLRAFLDSLIDRNSIGGAIFDCLFGFIESLVQYFNYYAYVHIAIYGKSYIQAAKDTWHLVKSRGVDAVVNDNIIGACLSLASLGIGMLVGIFGYLGTRYLSSATLETSVLVAGICLVTSSIICHTACNIIATGATTTFVCLAENPAALRRSDPELYNNILSRYSQITF